MKKYLTFETIADFLKYTVNLDFSLKETFALAIGQARIETEKEKLNCQPQTESEQELSSKSRKHIGVKKSSNSPLS